MDLELAIILARSETECRVRLLEAGGDPCQSRQQSNGTEGHRAWCARRPLAIIGPGATGDRLSIGQTVDITHPRSIMVVASNPRHRPAARDLGQ
jgi:hypothetical protein